MYIKPATRALSSAATKRKGTKAIAANQPIAGTAIMKSIVLILIPTISAGINPYFMFLNIRFILPIVHPVIPIPNAIGMCNIPNGKPLIIDVAIWPMLKTKAPSIAPKYNAEKNPGQESKATVGIGLGGWIKEPIILKAEKREILAMRELFMVFLALSTESTFICYGLKP